MQKILDTTKIQILSLARPLICQPDFPKMMEKGDIEDSKWFLAMDVIDPNAIGVLSLSEKINNFL